MQGSFEKEVQQKLEELNLKPSLPVWEKVEMQIRPEKRKRRPFFWLFFVALVCGGSLAAYYFIGYKAEVKYPGTFAPTTLHKETTANGNLKAQAPSLSLDTISINEDGLSHSNTNQLKKQEKTKETYRYAHKQKEGKSYTQSNTSNQINNANKQNSVYLQVDQETINNKPPTTVEKESQLKKPEIRSSLITTADTSTLHKQPTLEYDSLNVREKKALPVSPAATDTSFKKKMAVNNSKWKAHFNFIIGRVNSYQADSSRVLASALFQSPSAGNRSLSGPQKLSPGFGWSAGLSLSKMLAKKWEVSFGLQFTHYATHTKVGDKIIADTTVNNGIDKVAITDFYTNSGANNYTNSFNSIAVPVQISYQPSLTIPVVVSVGASYGRLLSTTALSYSSSSDIYYKSNKDYARNLLPVQASVQLRFTSKKGVQWQTGPMLQYNLLGLQNQTSLKTHLVFAGLKTDIGL